MVPKHYAHFSVENKHQWRKNPNESFSYISPLLAIFHVVFLLKKGGKMISTQADSICLTFHWENYWNSDKMKWEDIEFLFYSNREPLPYVTRLQRALTVAAAFHRLKLIEYPYLAMNYPLFLWWSETEASWKSMHVNSPRDTSRGNLTHYCTFFSA